MFKSLGGSAIVDCTMPDIGRRPERLREMSDRTDVTFVVGCGWYRQNYYRSEDRFDQRQVDELAEELIREIVGGYIIETYLPILRTAGVSEDLIQMMTVDNPRRVLTIADT